MKTGRILSDEVAVVNQILPHKHPWAWELFLKGQANNWVPTEISMAKDIEQWRGDALSADEKLLLKRCLGFFAGSESLVSNNLLLTIFKYVSDGECRQYVIRQMYEEALHNQTIVYVCDSLDLDVAEVYEAYQNVPAIKAKDDFLMKVTIDLARSGFDLSTIARRKEVLRNIIVYYLLCEGVLFYSGFAMLLSFGRQNKMPGLSEQIQYTVRDESLHLQFGTQLVNTIVAQEPELWDKGFREETTEQFLMAAELEVQYTQDVLPRGVLGLNPDLFVSYVQYVAKRRMEGIGLTSPWKNPKNPFLWMTETIDLAKQKNFFETRVIEYASGDWVDDL